MRTLPFFLIAYAITIAALSPAILARFGLLSGTPDDYLQAAPFAVFAPTIAAMLMARFERAGVRSVFRPLRADAWRVHPMFYLLALTMLGVLVSASLALHRIGGGHGPLEYIPRDAQHIAAMIIVPIGEEIGWRGFALPRLNVRYGRLRASLLLGVGWALWHVPLFLVSGYDFDGALLLSLCFFVPGSVVFSWLFSRTRDSLPLAILLHVGAHANNFLGPLPADPRAGLAVFTALTLLAVALVLFDRRAFER
jgi:membrane protease YdiL (CAAX protease family)